MTKATIGFAIIGITLIILGFDAFLYSDGVPGNSISQTIIYYGQKSMLVPGFVGFGMGFLFAHFFDNYQEPRE